MKVKDVMTPSAVCCSIDTNVGAAVELLWVNNCGMLPVVGNDRKFKELSRIGISASPWEPETVWRENSLWGR
jgi:CBS domain-containing protein